MNVAALQRTLAGEHAACWAYGVAGAHLRRPDQARALAALARHRALRDALHDLARASGAAPVPAEADYALPFPVASPAGARRLAVTIETRLSALYVALAEDAEAGPTRRLAVAAVTECSVRAVQWGGAAVAFPGR